METKQVKIALFVVMVFAGCYKEEPVLQNQVIVSTTANKSSIPADGVSRQLITVEINSEATDASNAITLTTTKGLFAVADKNTITVSAQNVSANGVSKKIATAYLVSTNEEGVAYVSTSLKNFTRVDTILFTRAYPDMIRLQVDKLNVESTNTAEVTVTTQLKRNTGTGIPSIGQLIELKAFDDASNEIGTFRSPNLLSDANGNCVNYFSLPAGSNFTGKIKLWAAVQTDAAGTIKRDSATITYYK